MLVYNITMWSYFATCRPICYWLYLVLCKKAYKWNSCWRNTELNQHIYVICRHILSPVIFEESQPFTILFGLTTGVNSFTRFVFLPLDTSMLSVRPPFRYKWMLYWPGVKSWAGTRWCETEPWARKYDILFYLCNIGGRLIMQTLPSCSNR